MTRVDLHTHTTVSDGTLSPRALLELAAERGVTVIAITDHDTTEGVPEATAAGKALGIEVVPGIELSCDLDDTVADDHADILGYFIDIDDPDFQALLARILTAREDRARRMVAQLQAIGAPIAFSDVAAISRHGAIGRPHVAHALVEAGFVEDVPTAFHKYIGRGRAGYADRYRLTPADACAAIRAAGGVPVLAHPVPPNNPWRDPKHLMTFLPPLAEAGLGGLECHYPGYTVRVVRWLNVLAKHFGLVPTGGSDYHGPWRAGRDLGSVDVPADTATRLRQAAEGSR